MMPKPGRTRDEAAFMRSGTIALALLVAIAFAVACGGSSSGKNSSQTLKELHDPKSAPTAALAGTPAAETALRAYVERRAERPRFAHGRSIRNAIDRARMRQASRLYDRRDALGRADLITIEAEDILASSVFADAPGDLS